MNLPIARDQMELLAELSGSMQWIVLAAGVVGTAIVLFKPKFRARRDPLERSPQSTSLSQQRSVDRQMQNLLVELSEMSRQVTASLDTRAAKLDSLIREADQKIAELTALRSSGHSIDVMTPDVIRPGAEALLDRTASLVMSDRHVPTMAAVPEMAMSGAGSPNGPLGGSPSAYDVDPRHAEVYLLADQGQSASDIAAQLQRPSGEIQLILALRPQA